MDYKFKINEFEGPLDLLLHLIKESEMDIMDIEIVKLTNQYLEYISNMERFNLNIASEYLVLASDLIYLKSKALLPQKQEEEIDEEYIETKENLINRLLEYKKYKDMIDTFKELESSRKDIFTKDPINLSEYTDYEVNNNGEVSLEDLLNALNEFLKRKEDEKPRETKVTKKELSVTDRTIQIRDILKKKRKVSFFDLFEIKTKEYVVVTFLSILEMAKFGEISIVQENNFNNILITTKEGVKDE